MKLQLTRLLIFTIMCGLLLYMGYRPNEWEYLAVVACGVGIGIEEYNRFLFMDEFNYAEDNRIDTKFSSIAVFGEEVME